MFLRNELCLLSRRQLIEARSQFRTCGNREDPQPENTINRKLV